MPDASIELGPRGFAGQLGAVVREARTLIGWSQRDLARRAHTTQTLVCRLERGRLEHLDLLVAERVLAELGIRARLQLDARHLADRRRQLDAVHAFLTGYIARRLRRLGWLIALEVALGEGAPRGWIDLLAFRPADGALLVEETKTDIPDMGALQRSLAFYEREAVAAARRLGWEPRRVVVAAIALDSATIGRRLADNRDVVAAAFPESVERLVGWLTDPAQKPPRGWVLAMADPAIRGAAWLRPTLLGSRRRPPAYTGYPDAAARLLRR